MLKWLIDLIVIGLGVFFGWYDNPLYRSADPEDWQWIGSLLILGGFVALLIHTIMWLIDYAKRR